MVFSFLQLKLLRAIKTVVRRKAGKSDVKRWSDSTNLHGGWDERTELMAGYIKSGDRVIDFGAGKMVLKKFLPPGCAYLPTDIVPREDGMVVADLNKLPLPNLGLHDIAVFSGVLEYIHDVRAVVEAIRPIISRVAVSYSILENKPQILRRRANGFANDYTEAQFKELFLGAGFDLISRGLWREQVLFHFKKS